MSSVIQFTSHGEKLIAGKLRILVLKLDHRGDFAVSLPALIMLRRLVPEAHIGLVVSSWNESFAREQKVADEIFIYDLFSEDGTRNLSRSDFRSIFPASVEYEMAIDLRVDNDTRFLLEAIPAQIKCGFSDSSENSFLDLKFNLPDFAQGSKRLAIQYINYDVSSSGQAGTYQWKAPLQASGKVKFSVTSIVAKGSREDVGLRPQVRLGLRSSGWAPLRVAYRIAAWNDGRLVGSAEGELRNGLPLVERAHTVSIPMETWGEEEGLRFQVEVVCIGGIGFVRMLDIPWADPDGEASLRFERSLLHRSEQYAALIGACVQRLNRSATDWKRVE